MCTIYEEISSFQSHLTLCNLATLWTVACQAPLYLEFSRKEYWSGLLCPPPGESSQSRNWTHIFCSFPTAGRFFTADPLGKPHMYVCVIRKRRKQRSHIHKKNKEELVITNSSHFCNWSHRWCKYPFSPFLQNFLCPPAITLAFCGSLPGGMIEIFIPEGLGC